MDIFERLLSIPADDLYRVLFAISIMAIAFIVGAIARALLRIVNGIMDNNKTLMQQQVVTMQDISASLALHNQAATMARSQTMISLKQGRHETRENRKILQQHMLDSDMLYSLVGDISVTERETRGKINDVIIPAIVRIEHNVDALMKAFNGMRGSHENRGTQTDETINLVPLPATGADSANVAGGDASTGAGGSDPHTGSSPGT